MFYSLLVNLNNSYPICHPNQLSNFSYNAIQHYQEIDCLQMHFVMKISMVKDRNNQIKIEVQRIFVLQLRTSSSNDLSLKVELKQQVNFVEEIGVENKEN